MKTVILEDNADISLINKSTAFLRMFQKLYQTFQVFFLRMRK